MIWVLFGIITFLVVGFLIRASRVQERAGNREAGALAIYEDQLNELARDTDRGVISQAERNAAEIEIKRRMLRLKPAKEQDKTGNPAALLVAAAIVPLGAAVLYFGLGRPDIPAAPFAERVAETQELEDLTDRLRTALLTDPNGGETEGWRLLATTYANQGWHDRALEAYRELLTRADATSVDFSRGAEIAIQAARGAASAEAKAWAEQSLALSPENPAASYYLAYILNEEGQKIEALEVLSARVAMETTFLPWMPWFIEFGQELAAATGQEMFSFPEPSRGPSAEDIEAAEGMSEEDRSAMIEGMVEGLASRLEEEPFDIDGWLQLARAYTVLGEVDNAVAAFNQVMTRTQSDDPRRSLAQQGLAALQ